MNRTTIISIIATSLIIGLSIGLTTYFNPQKMSSLTQHTEHVMNDDTMKSMCTNFEKMMKQDKLNHNKNNVMAYNLQRLHGQCYIKTGDHKKPIELLKINGCNSSKGSYKWELKNDSSIFDFCPNMNIS